MGVTSTTRGALAASLLVLAACASAPELEEARAEEQRAEAIVEDIEALPDGTPGKAELLADAVEAEAELEKLREDLEKLTRDGLIDAGIDAARDAASGDYLGASETLFGVALAALGVYLRRKNRKDLEDLERRRDESRAAQGIQPNSNGQFVVNRTPQTAPAGAAQPNSPATGAPGFTPSPQAAPTPSAATFYGDPNRFPAAPVVEGPNV